MARIGFAEKVTFEYQEGEGIGHMDIWGKNGQPVQMLQVLSVSGLSEKQ